MSESEFSSNDRQQLEFSLRKVWGFGANVVVGWRFLAYGIQVAYLSSYRLPKLAKEHPELLLLDRRVNSDEDFNALIKSGCKEQSIDFPSRTKASVGMTDAVNDIIRGFSVTYFPSRAVALINLINFSRHSAFEQVAQINSLIYNLNLAERRCQSIGLPIKLSMTTTGENFYVWNQNQGVSADIALYCALMLALGYIYAARKLLEREAVSVPRLNCAIHFGSHYEYFHGTGRFIVGTVTVNLARLAAKALPNQFLIASDTLALGKGEESLRNLIGSDSIDTMGFMALAQQEIKKLVGTPIPGGKVQSIQVFLTGPKASERSFAIRKYYVEGNDEAEHPCFNGKLNLIADNGERFTFGLLNSDLDDFDARADENEDILIQFS
jgi:hypothetical protein